MPRYYRRRYTRIVRPKKKWATNIKHLSEFLRNQAAPTNYYTEVLAENSTQGQFVTPTPTILKVGNFKVQSDVSYTTAAAGHVEVRAYVLFMPEGVVGNSYADYETIINNHPEWIMGWKYASNDYITNVGTAGTQTMNFSSRLKRNLNSGDRVIFLCLLVAAADTPTQTTNITSFTVGGQAQFWTCAN